MAIGEKNKRRIKALEAVLTALKGWKADLIFEIDHKGKTTVDPNEVEDSIRTIEEALR